MSSELERKPKPVPFYTKVGWVVSWIVMVILVTMILRNCVASVKYGSQTEDGTVETYYQLGITDSKLDKVFAVPADVMENPVLRKAYARGYREGMDEKWK